LATSSAPGLYDPAPTRASAGEPFGFLCRLNAERDKPQLPTAEEMARLAQNPAVAAFLNGGAVA
jgi:hypothetical protein